MSGLGEHVVIGDGPFGIAGCVAYGRLFQGCVSDTQHAEFRGHSFQVRTNPIEVRVRGVVGESRGNRVLGRCVVGNGFPVWIQEDCVNVWQVAEGAKECGKFCSCPVADGSGEKFMLYVPRRRRFSYS
jgi:hypothetical protein